MLVIKRRSKAVPISGRSAPTASTVPRCIFVDRDGTLIEEKHHLHDPAQVVLLPNTIAGLQLLQQRGCGLVVVTNQAGIGRGYYTEDDMHACNHRMCELLEIGGVTLDGIYFCPHAPHQACACRKPKPGMALQAAQELGIELAGSWVIGDKALDVNLATAIGGRGILVRTGYGLDEQTACSPHAIADDVLDAARIIIGLCQ